MLLCYQSLMMYVELQIMSYLGDPYMFTKPPNPFQEMMWDCRPPASTPLGDHDVPLLNPILKGTKIALLIGGGIAAMKAPLIARALRKRGAEVHPFVSPNALRYVTSDALAWACDHAVVQTLSARAEHLGDGVKYDAYLFAPATYNTINKCAYGIADTVLTTLFSSALGRLERGHTQILLAPTMHGTMHNQILSESLIRLQKLGVTLISPRPGYGKHNLPHEEHLVIEVARAVSRSELKGKGILITGGPTPVPIDDVRLITNKFTGRLAVEITQELVYRGAHPHLLLGKGSMDPPNELLPWIEFVKTYDEYHKRVIELSQSALCKAGIFSAAVADYQLEVSQSGKIPSGQDNFNLKLVPTVKVIDQVHQNRPQLPMITFKYQEGISHEALMKIARERAQRFGMVFANRGEERGPNGEQVGWLVSADQLDSPQKCVGKKQIARALCDALERLFYLNYDDRSQSN